MELQVPRLSAAAGDSKCDHFPRPFAAGGFRLDGRVSRDNASRKSETIFINLCNSYYKSTSFAD
jgi:hypothetical protein